ncbi:hypothetical protein LTR37_008402 [Vermiconidia calcicola]|uniref:Uncharacterized protein n=1 Tax=Vermiconidia calcicola TaxID=1690605 RepID=A0ACC3NAN0_9PEZI|nr:hypothetical protein LTR37_008402 [Vermiconidia calcicola]
MRLISSTQKRKIACDLARPSCSQCTKSKWQCPGYDTHSRFYVYGESGRGSAATSGPSKATAETRTALAARTRPVFPNSDSDAPRNVFVFKLKSEATAARFMIVPEHQILNQFVVRIGHSSALDDAVHCVCSRPNQSRETETKPFAQEQSYLKAINSLQRSLNDTERCLASETIAAATLLQMFEHSISPFQQNWVAHANGVIKMLELRGPERIDNDLERAIFQAQFGNIFSNAVQGRSACFLAEPRWRALLDPPGRPDGTNLAQSFPWFNVAAFFPGILSNYEQLQGNRAGRSGYYEDRGLCIETSDRPASDFDVDNCLSDSFVPQVFRVRQYYKEWRVRHDCTEDTALPTAKRQASEQNNLARRISVASKLSVNVISMMLDYITMDIGSIDIRPNTLRDDYELSSMAMAASGRFGSFASKARSRLEALKQMDSTASTYTARLTELELDHFLEAAYKTNSRPDLLAVVDDMVLFLGGHKAQLVMESCSAMDRDKS